MILEQYPMPNLKKLVSKGPKYKGIVSKKGKGSLKILLFNYLGETGEQVWRHKQIKKVI